ncbi:uncharacterized protein LOC111907053 [Lactuca sativa]|uniref:uncharacterized protein LOC111907053 n=1 Tax=Lactuca sativa TaxID=4236 RepID=UPI000CD91504|nr:uncharacterized protein LOC111907053 [Lactuca sativa]
MNCLCLNVRGCGVSHKIDWILRIKNSQKVDFVGIQETWVADPNDIDFTGAWGNSNFEVAFVNPVGRSGGIVSMWDPMIFVRSHIFSSRNYLAIYGNWNGIPGTTTLMNVYGPQSVCDKRKLWEDLLKLKRSINGIWIFFGDFNAVRYDFERFNSRFCRATARDFNKFIVDAGLQEFNLGGKKFTYLCDDGLKLNKLDRYLVCSNFIAHQPLTIVIVLPREHSDHTPLILKPSNQDFGPTPCRFFNSWIHKDGFEHTFTQAYNSFRGFGAPDMYLKAKLKFVKKKIINWRKSESDVESTMLTQIKKKVEHLEMIVESRCLTDAEIKDRIAYKSKIAELENFLSKIYNKSKNKMVGGW